MLYSLALLGTERTGSSQKFEMRQRRRG